MCNLRCPYRQWAISMQVPIANNVNRKLSGLEAMMNVDSETIELDVSDTSDLVRYCKRETVTSSDREIACHPCSAKYLRLHLTNSSFPFSFLHLSDR